MGRTGPKTGLSDLLRTLSKRPQGVSSSDPQLARFDSAEVGTRAGRLIAQGEIFRAKLAHKRCIYFGTQAEADACVERASKLRMREWQPVKPEVSASSIPGWAEAEPDFSKAKVTIGNPFVPRFQAIELPGLHGALQRGRVTG